MAVVASRDLRNHTADVLRTVAEGTRVTVTVNGRPVASSRPTTMSRTQLAALLTSSQADAGLRDDLVALGDESTDWVS